MDNQKPGNRIEKIRNSIPALITDVVEKASVNAKPGEKVLFTMIKEREYMASFSQSVTKEMKREEYIIIPTELSPICFVTDLYKYKKDKKIPIKTKAITKEIAFSKMKLYGFYEIVEGNYHISDRMVRRYIGRGLIPPPERYGKNAFYDQARSDVFSFLNVIDTLKKRYNLSLDDIEEIVNNYRDQILKLDFILADIESEYNQPRRTSPKYVWVKKYFLEKIQAKTENLDKLNIKTMEKEIKRKQS